MGLDASAHLPVGRRRHDQCEWFFVARAGHGEVSPTLPDSYIIGHRWWTLNEIRDSLDDFAPRRIAALLPAILDGAYPEVPLDCGV